MKTYLELEGRLGTQPQLQPSINTYLPDKNPSPQKKLVPKKAQKKKRKKAPVKRRFKVRVFVQPMPNNPTLPMNPTLLTNPTPTAVTTKMTSTQMSVAGPATTTAKTSLIPVTVYNLAQGKFKEIPYPTRKSHEEEGPSAPSSNNPPVDQQSEAATTAMPCRMERTPHGQLPCQPL